MPDLVQHVRRGNVRGRFPYAEGANSLPRSGHAEQVIQPYAEQASGRVEKGGHDEHGAGNEGIDHGKGFQHSLVGINQAFHGVIVKPQHHVGIQGQPGQRLVRLGGAAVSFKPEGADDDADDVGALLLGQPRHLRRHAGACCASQPGGEDGQRTAFQSPEDGGFTFTGGLCPHGGIPAGAEPPGKPGPQMDLARNGGGVQQTGIQIHGAHGNRLRSQQQNFLHHLGACGSNAAQADFSG